MIPPNLSGESRMEDQPALAKVSRPMTEVTSGEGRFITRKPTCARVNRAGVTPHVSTNQATP
jgi:hypothetical protein